MPQLSDTMAEGTVVKWRKQEGDRVKAGDVVAEIETDKATMEMEAFEAGTLAYIAVPEGGKVAVGATIALLAIGKENPAEVKKQFGSLNSATPVAAAAPAPLKAADADASSSSPVHASPYATATLEDAARGEVHEPDEVGHHATRSIVPPDETAPSPPNGNGGRIRISPLAKRIATDKGFDISRITGTGPQGRIIQRDVLNFTAPAAKPAPLQPAPTPQAAPRPAAGAKTVIPLTKMRLSSLSGCSSRSRHCRTSMRLSTSMSRPSRSCEFASISSWKRRRSVCRSATSSPRLLPSPCNAIPH